MIFFMVYYAGKGAFSMSEARTRASRKWNEANLDRLAITVKKGDRDRIKAAAEKAGVSVNRYVTEAIEARMAAESS